MGCLFTRIGIGCHTQFTRLITVPLIRLSPPGLQLQMTARATPPLPSHFLP